MLMMNADAERNDMDGKIIIVTTATLGQTMTVIMTVPKTMTTTMMRTDNAAGGDDDRDLGGHEPRHQARPRPQAARRHHGVRHRPLLARRHLQPLPRGL